MKGNIHSDENRVKKIRISDAVLILNSEDLAALKTALDLVVNTANVQVKIY